MAALYAGPKDCLDALVQGWIVRRVKDRGHQWREQRIVSCEEAKKECVRVSQPTCTQRIASSTSRYLKCSQDLPASSCQLLERPAGQ